MQPTQTKQHKYHDVEAEEELLAGMINLPKLALTPGVGPHLFTGERVKLCDGVCALHRIGETVTPKNLELRGCDEPALLAFSLVTQLGHYPDNGEAKLIVEKLTSLALRRHACTAMRELHADVSGLGAGELMRRLNDLGTSSQRILDGSDVKAMQNGADVDELVEDLRRRIEKPDLISGLSTGMGMALDRALDGLQGSRLILLGGRPHLGKTSLGIQFTEGVLSAEKSVAYFSAEMTKLNLQQAMLDLLSGVQLKPGIIPNKGELARMKLGMTKMATFKWHVDDSNRMDIDTICAKSRILHRSRGLDMVVVDYVQIIMGCDVRDDMRLMIAEISGKLKALSKELNIPVVLLSQINRAQPRTDPKTGGNIYPKPTLANLKESSSLESDADVVILIDRNLECEVPGEPEVDCSLIIAKNRQTGLLVTIPSSFVRANRAFKIKNFWSPY
jgi:replicative DNA helicase